MELLYIINKIIPEFELYPDEIADQSLVEAEDMAYEISCNEKTSICENISICGKGSCDSCSTTWSCFPVNPMKTWNDMTIDEKDIIRTQYPKWVGL